MSTELANIAMTLLVILASWTATVATLVWWLGARFRSLESLIYRKAQEERDRIDSRLFDHGKRLYRLEYQVNDSTSFGHVGPNGGE